MEVRGHPNRILELRLSGKYAQFRKFYTNASSLTYSIPPRTVLAGLFASILKLPRDSYYHTLSSDRLRIAVSLLPGCTTRRFMQTMNYLSGNSEKEPVNDASKHRQCRLEILAAESIGELKYRVWLGFNNNDELLRELENKLISGDLGYGVYLGQRQFRASVCVDNSYSITSIDYAPVSEYIDSSFVLSNGQPVIDEPGSIQIERQPLEQVLNKSGKNLHRATSRVGDVVFHTSGLRMRGRFENCYRLSGVDKETIIGFL